MVTPISFPKKSARSLTTSKIAKCRHKRLQGMVPRLNMHLAQAFIRDQQLRVPHLQNSETATRASRLPLEATITPKGRRPPLQAPNAPPRRRSPEGLPLLNEWDLPPGATGNGSQGAYISLEDILGPRELFDSHSPRQKLRNIMFPKDGLVRVRIPDMGNRRHTFDPSLLGRREIGDSLWIQSHGEHLEMDCTE
ncbi:hypothetical protein BDZ91DRAFT_820035 [Kalaharituber pfeilii]|nr:hypothetical protein BDZ91DRAFT_820035 [Kalaharituber pfeilii]